METTKDGELAKHTHSIPSSSVLNLYIGHFLARWGSRFIQFSLIIFLLTAWFFSPLSTFCLGLITGFCGVFTFYYCRKSVWNSWIACLFWLCDHKRFPYPSVFVFVYRFFFTFHCASSPTMFCIFFATLLTAKGLFFFSSWALFCLSKCWTILMFKWVFCSYFPKYELHCTLFDEAVFRLKLWNATMVIISFTVV